MSGITQENRSEEAEKLVVKAVSVWKSIEERLGEIIVSTI